VKNSAIQILVVIMTGLSMLAAVVAYSSEKPSDLIRGALEKWTVEFNTGKSGQVCELFAPDLIANYQGQPERNYESLCRQLRNSLGDRNRTFHYSLDIKEILVSGDLAAVRLVWTLKIVPNNGGEAHTVVEPGIDIFRPQPDGTWKISRFVAYGESR